MDVDNVSLIADAKVNLERTLGLFSNSKRLKSGDGSSQNQSVNVMSACGKKRKLLLINLLSYSPFIKMSN